MISERKAMLQRNMEKSIVSSDLIDTTPVFSEAEFDKAQENGDIEVFTVSQVSAFERTLQKSIDSWENSAVKPASLAQEIEKAKKDLSKLVKVRKQDKNGKTVTVYVRANQEKQNSNLSKPKGDLHDSGLGVHVPKTMKHSHLGQLEHSRDVEGEGGNHKHYYKDKDGHEVHFTTGTLVEHGMAEKKQSSPGNGKSTESHDRLDLAGNIFDFVENRIGSNYSGSISEKTISKKIEKFAQSKGGLSDDTKRKILDYVTTELDNLSSDSSSELRESIQSFLDKEPNSPKQVPDYGEIREFAGEDYSDQIIHSVFEAFGGEEAMNKKFKYSDKNNRTQAAQSAHIYNVIDSYLNQSDKRPKNLSKDGLVEILWGIGMNAQNK